MERAPLPKKRLARAPEYRALDIQVLAVAIKGVIDDWSAYIGAVRGENHEEEYNEVAHNGSKLPQEVAEILFPNWKESNSGLRWRY